MYDKKYKEIATSRRTKETKMLKQSYFGIYEVYQKLPLTNINLPFHIDSRIIKINLQKTSQPCSRDVCKEKQTVRVMDIAKDKISEFCVGDWKLKINVQDIIHAGKNGQRNYV